jgi:hypothetical protein
MPTRWHPDTCGCVFDVDEEWKSAEAVTICERHAGMDAFVEAHGDNIRKNLAHAAVEKDHPELSDSFKWAYAADGELQIIFEAETTRAKRDAVTRSIDNKLAAANRQEDRNKKVRVL